MSAHEMAGSISALIPEFQPDAHALVDAAGAAGFQPRVTSTLRTRTEQTRLYRRYLAGLSQFPAAPPGRSAHEYGYAIDILCATEEADLALGDYWSSAGGVWHPSDRIHYEYPGFEPPSDDTGSGGRLQPLIDEVKTWGEWTSSLPWWAQMLLPDWTSAVSNELVTASEWVKLLQKLGLK